MFRMTAIFEKLKTAGNPKAKHFFDVRNERISEHPKIPNLAREFFEFSSNYFKDGIYFFKKKMFIESFEAFIISWSYIDCGLKLGFFQVPKEQREWFTA